MKKLHLGSCIKPYFYKRNVGAFSIYPLNKSTQCSKIGRYENKGFSELRGYLIVPRYLNSFNLALYYIFLSKFMLTVIGWKWAP